VGMGWSTTCTLLMGERYMGWQHLGGVNCRGRHVPKKGTGARDKNGGEAKQGLFYVKKGKSKGKTKKAAGFNVSQALRGGPGSDSVLRTCWGHSVWAQNSPDDEKLKTQSKKPKRMN